VLKCGSVKLITDDCWRFEIWGEEEGKSYAFRRRGCLGFLRVLDVAKKPLGLSSFEANSVLFCDVAVAG